MLSLGSTAVALIVTIAGALVARIFYNLYVHPLSKFDGPWYAASFSLVSAIISVRQQETQWLLSLVRKYGRDKPIRIAPNLLLCPNPDSVSDIYWDPACNTKGGLYSSGALGPPTLFSISDSDEHRVLRKALGGPQWSIGALKSNWEPRMDELLQLLVQRITELVEKDEEIFLSDKLAQFAADTMTTVVFSYPWGFVKNSRDERDLLQNWRATLPFFGLVGRWRWFRETVLTSPLALYLLPTPDDKKGTGFLMSQADLEVIKREQEIDNGSLNATSPDFLRYTLEARIKNKPLTPVQKRAHITLLIMAGADTTATALSSTIRFLLQSPEAMSKALAEITAAEDKGRLSTPIAYDETRVHLPYFAACIKEAVRLHPPATNLFARVVPAQGKMLSSGEWVPPGSEITTNAFVVHRDAELYAPDPEIFRPERWLESREKAVQMEAANFAFGCGPRICLGKEVAIMEMYKVIPEIIRRFDMTIVEAGEYIVAGGVAYNQGFKVRARCRA